MTVTRHAGLIVVLLLLLVCLFGDCCFVCCNDDDCGRLWGVELVESDGVPFVSSPLLWLVSRLLDVESDMLTDSTISFSEHVAPSISCVEMVKLRLSSSSLNCVMVTLAEYRWFSKTLMRVIFHFDPINETALWIDAGADNGDDWELLPSWLLLAWLCALRLLLTLLMDAPLVATMPFVALLLR